MKQITLMEKYPVFTLFVDKNETTFKNVDEIIDFLKGKIENDPVATFIAVFDHYGHTKSLPNGEVNPSIKAAKDLVFCFGAQLKDAKVLAVRPRSFGIAELENSFEIAFLEAPNPMANEKMETWAKEIKNK
ncbi:MAG: hypothetical protein GXO31_06590 [Epsilonproteobacteria bacterium]|nr:hypothetical protein [Campylobacterota bacterium]